MEIQNEELWSYLRRILNSAMELIYPENAVCMGCGSIAGFDGKWLCEDCRKLLAKRWDGGFWDAELDGSAAAYRYRGPAGGMVQNLKYRGVLRLAEPMAEDMMRACKQIQPIGAEMVVPVPMHARRLKKRGYNQSELLAREVAERLGVPFENAIERTKNTVQQARLTEEMRRKNLKDAFLASPSVAGWRVLLIDDVYTTGETARACARALREAGAITVSFLAYARSGK